MGEVPGAKYKMYDIVFIKDLILFSHSWGVICIVLQDVTLENL